MKIDYTIELTAETYIEEQNILASFPGAIWIKLSENRTKFYIKYDRFAQVKKFLADQSIDV